MFGRITACDAHAINYTFTQAGADPSPALCVLLHGLFSDRNENGRYQRLSDLLSAPGTSTPGLDSIRFDFRGHGESGLDSSQFTLSGALNDLSAVLLSAVSHGYNTIYLIASSFSACTAALYHALPQAIAIQKIVLLNPVIDLQATVLMARQSNGQMVFSEDTVNNITQHGQQKLPNGFNVSVNFYNEICLLKPYECIAAIKAPIMVFHGTADEKADYKISVSHFAQRENCQLVLLDGAVHTFKNPDHEVRVFNQLKDWLFQANTI